MSGRNQSGRVAAFAPMMALAACAHVTTTPPRLTIPTVNITEGRAYDTYTPVPPAAAEVLGCASAPSLPICEVTPPSPEEDSAFQAEAARLKQHAVDRCRDLGATIETHLPGVRMYRKALVRESGNGRQYGVGHTYALDDAWLVRVARRIDDLNERSLEDKKRTLRHEMSHTLGASESGDLQWSAEDYALRCG